MREDTQIPWEMAGTWRSKQSPAGASTREEVLLLIAQAHQPVAQPPLEPPRVILVDFEAHGPALTSREVLDAELVHQRDRVVETERSRVGQRPVLGRLEAP